MGFTVSEILVWFVKLPDEPVTVTVNAPMAAAPLAVSVNVLVLVVGFATNDAVTPVSYTHLTLPTIYSV